MDILSTFIVGGSICGIAQILIDKFNFNSAKILVFYVSFGVFLTGIGVYEYIVEYGGYGATIPLPGFGYALGKGVMKGVDEDGLLGIISGGISGTAAGISAAIFFGYIMAIIFNPKTKD